MLRRLREVGARWQRVCEAFGLEPRAHRRVAQAALNESHVLKAHLLSFGPDGRIRSKDISTLDPGDEDDDVSEWGGLAGFSSRFGETVRRAVNEADG